MIVKAEAKNVRLSPEKVRLVVAQIKKMSPQKAVTMLGFVNKSSSPVLKKVINSAIANAKNNFGLDEQTLAFKEFSVGKGPMSKRYRPVSRGRAHAILKRTSHIKVILEGEPKKNETNKSDKTNLTNSKEAKNGTKS